MKMTFTGMIAWGGSRDDETLVDVLSALRDAAPSIMWARIVDVSSGGWPVYQFICDSEDIENVAAHWEMDVEDLGAVEA